MHWSAGIAQSPDDAGFWSVTKAEDVHTVSRDWETYSSASNILLADHLVPVEFIQRMFIGMDPPKHDRLKALFQKAFTPKAIAQHEPAIREITARVMDGLEGRETCDLVTEVAQPVVARVIGSFMGLDPEDDKPWAEAINTLIGFGDPDLNADGIEQITNEQLPRMYEKCMKLVADRRANPTDDMLSTLVFAEIEGDMLTDEEIFSGFVLLMAAGNDSTKATYTSTMRALMENPDQRELLIDGPVARAERRRGGAAHVPGVRALPPHRHEGHRARRLPDRQGRQGRALVPVVQPRRGSLRGAGPLRRHAQPRAPGLRRRRPALLPRDGTRAAGAPDPRRGVDPALPEDDDGRRADLGPLAVLEPAQDAAGAPPRIAAPRPAARGQG